MSELPAFDRPVLRRGRPRHTIYGHRAAHKVPTRTETMLARLVALAQNPPVRIAPIVIVAVAAALNSVGCVEPSFECLAPANPGGGWDLTCRAVAQVFAEESITPRPTRVRNLPGAGGGIAFAHVVAERRGDPDVLVAASPATTLRLAQGQFGSLVPGDVRWLGAVAADFGVVVVRADSKWRTLDELMASWRLTPSDIVAAGGSAVGGQDHMKLLLLADAAGIDPKGLCYVPFDGGGEATASLLGGFVSVLAADVSEIVRHAEVGNVRVLSVLAPHRLAPPLDDVPTARELGYDMQWVVWRGFYAPAGLDDADYDAWVLRLDRLAASESWEALRRRYGLSSFVLVGDEFEDYVRQQVTRFEALTATLGLAR